MPLTHFPHGASSFGIPQVNGGFNSIPDAQGTVWFVDAVAGSDGNAGTDPTQAFKTISRAILLAGNGTGDTIFIFPGVYAENLVVDKAKLSLCAAVKTGYGKRVIIEPAAGTALLVQAVSCYCFWLRFHSQDTTPAMQVQGDGFVFYGCDFSSDGGSGALVIPNATDPALTGSQGIMSYCQFRDNAAAALLYEPIAGYGTTDNLVEDCWFYNNTVMDVQTTVEAAQQDVWIKSIIRNCYFGDTNKAVYISMATGTGNQGLIAGCYFADRTAGGIDGTKCAIAALIAVSGCYDSLGLIDAHAF